MGYSLQTVQGKLGNIEFLFGANIFDIWDAALLTKPLNLKQFYPGKQQEEIVSPTVLKILDIAILSPN